MSFATSLKWVWLGTASLGTLSIGGIETAQAQSSNLPPVTIDAPNRQQVRRAAPPRQAAQSRATRSVATPVRTGPAAPIAAAGAGFAERGTGPVNGYVAQQSVSGTKTDSPLLTTPQAISVVPRKQIEDQQPQSLSETLRYTPGATVNTYGVNSLFDTIRIRGFEAPVYLDGLRFSQPTNLAFTGQRLEPFGLERVEILRGPSSGLYGSMPPGGLVNAISKRPQPIPFADVTLQGGNFDRVQGTFDVNSPLDAQGQWLMRMTGLVREAGTQLDFQRDNRYFVAPSLTWRPTADTTFTILASVQKSSGIGYQQYVPAAGSALPNPNGRIPYSRYLGEPASDRFSSEQASIGYAFEHRFNEYVQFRQNLRYTDATSDLQAVRVEGLSPDQRTALRSALGVAVNAKSVAIDNQLQFDFSIGPVRHKVLAGVDHYNIEGNTFFAFAPAPTIDAFAPVYGAAILAGGALTPVFNTDTKLNQTGVYVQDQISIDRLTLTATARADSARSRSIANPTFFSAATTETSRADAATTGRIGLSYLFDNGIAPYAAYATSFDPTPGTDISGTTFKPTTGELREVGVKFRPLGTNALFTAALFDITQQNVLTTNTANPSFQVQTGAIRVKGFELEGRYSFTDRLDLIAGYSRIDPRITADTTNVVGNYVANTPLETASLWALYTERSGAFAGWGLGGGVRHVGRSFADNANSFATASYTLFDALLSYDFGARDPRLRGLKFQLNATNIGNTYYVANCFGATYCALGAARTVLGTLRYRFQPG